jgi:cation diffusion facilitator family transporter
MAARDGTPGERVGRAERLAGAGVGVGLLVLALKAGGWWLTGSAALYSDALESTVNVAASALAFGALRMAARPADANHPYGHEKAEFFAAVVEGVLVVVAALSILQAAWRSYVEPHPLTLSWQGVGLNVAATVVNAIWSSALIREGRKLRSPALSADGRHVRSDVVSSVAIVAGVGAVAATGIQLLDPAIAAAAAVHVLWSGLRVIATSVGGLMDAAPSEAVVARIRTLVGENADGAIEAHDLRMRHAGRASFLEFHLVVPGAMSVADAHAICDRVEAALRAEMDGINVSIHVEPEVKAKHHGVLVL